MNIDDDNNRKDLQLSTELDIDYSELDPQKGCNSPRELFKSIIEDRISKQEEWKKFTKEKEFKNRKNSIDKEVKETPKDNKESKERDKEKAIEREEKNISISINSNLNSKKELDNFSLFDSYKENYLDFVNEIYFSTPNSNNSCNNKNTVLNKKKPEEIDLAIGNTSNKFKFTSLDFLLNPLRASLPFEKWSPYEIALFEACICKFGKDFELFKTIIQTKNLDEIQEFYYCWEKSKYYDAWVTTQIKKGKYPNKLF